MKIRILAAIGCVALIGAVGVFAQDGAKAKPEHLVLTPADLKWGDAPAILPAGAKVSVLEGDPSKEGYFAMRLKVPAGYKVPPHSHPGDERVTVISGKMQLGFGDKLDATKVKDLPPGSYFSLPTTAHHFAIFPEETIIQLSTMGPWGLTYVDPADDPTKKK